MAVRSFLFLQLAFGTLAALSAFPPPGHFTFSSVSQCGNFTVSWTGLPLTSISVLVLPLASTKSISLNVPQQAWTSNSSGVFINFLPLPTDTLFIATVLNNTDGRSIGHVSDLLKIGPSEDSTCLPATNASSIPPPFVNLTSSPVQCESLSLSFNSSDPPTVTGFIPLFFGFPINETSTDESSKTAAYLLSAPRLFQLVLLFDDGRGNKQITDLLSVGGDASSSTSCFPPGVNNAVNGTAPPNQQTSLKGLSKGAVIAIGVSSGFAVGVLIIGMALYILRERRRRRALNKQGIFEIETASRYPPRVPEKDGLPDSPTRGDESFIQPVRNKADGDNASLATVEIEHILDMTKLYPLDTRNKPKSTVGAAYPRDVSMAVSDSDSRRMLMPTERPESIPPAGSDEYPYIVQLQLPQAVQPQTSDSWTVDVLRRPVVDDRPSRGQPPPGKF